MSLLHGFLPTNRNAEVAGTTPTHTDGGDSPNNIMRAPNASVSGRRDTVRLTLPDKTLSVAETTPRYSKRPSGKFKSSAHFSFVCILLVYYRLYAEDGAIPSKTPVAPGDPFLGRIKARSVPPPHTAKAVKRSIAKVEDIKDRTSTSLFLTSYSQSPMSDADKVTIRNRTGPGSTPQKPLALVAKMSESERSALESDGRGGHANTAAEPDTTPQEIRYRTSIQHSPTFLFIVISRLLGEVYYLLYADDYEIPSKVALDPLIQRSFPLVVSEQIQLCHHIVLPPSNDAFREWREPLHLSTPIFLQTHHVMLHWKKVTSQSFALMAVAQA